MTDLISELPAGQALDRTEQLPMIQGDPLETRRFPLSAIRKRHKGYLANRHYNIFGSANCILGSAAALPGADIALCYPFIAEADNIDWKGFALRVTTVGAGSAFKSALYTQDAATLRPNLLLAGDNIGISTASLTAITTSIWSAVRQPVVGETYFAVIKATGTMPQTLQFANTNSLGQYLMGEAIGGSAGGTPQGLQIASPYANAWADFDPAAVGWSMLNGAQPLPFIAT
jgi:hypothetical protein